MTQRGYERPGGALAAQAGNHSGATPGRRLRDLARARLSAAGARGGDQATSPGSLGLRVGTTKPLRIRDLMPCHRVIVSRYAWSRDRDLLACGMKGKVAERRSHSGYARDKEKQRQGTGRSACAIFASRTLWKTVLLNDCACCCPLKVIRWPLLLAALPLPSSSPAWPASPSPFR